MFEGLPTLALGRKALAENLCLFEFIQVDLFTYLISLE